MTSNEGPRPSGNDGRGLEQDHSEVHDTRPEVVVNDRDLTQLTDEVIQRLNEANNPEPVLFRQGRSPVRLSIHDGRPHLERTTSDRLVNFAARHIAFVRTEVKNNTLVVKTAAPPRAAIANVLADPTWVLPPLERIVGVPVFNPSGDIRTKPGYDRASRLVYVPATGLTVPQVSDAPDPDEVQTARDRLLDLVTDFPFVADSDRAHAIAAAALPFMRATVDGPTPLHWVTAPTRGTGKTLLAKALVTPSSGGVVGVNTQAKWDEEWRKKIGAILSGGPSTVFFDNVTGRLDAPSLAAALTTEVWEDRVLGKNDEALLLPNRAMWIMTGNNATLSDELARRAIPIRLDAHMERPYDRDPEEFQHPNILRWAQRQRGDLVWAVLTLGRAWIAAGRPEGRPLGGFEEWGRVIGGVLDVAGINGFLNDIGDFRATVDEESIGWAELFRSAFEKFGSEPFSAGDLRLVYIDTDFLNLGPGRWPEQIRSQETKLGIALKKRKDAIYGDLKLKSAGTLHGGNRWRLELPTGYRRS